MAYAGEEYGRGGQYSGNAANAVNPVPIAGMPTERAAGALVLGALVALILIHRGFRGVSIGRATGGLVRG